MQEIQAPKQILFLGNQGLDIYREFFTNFIEKTELAKEAKMDVACVRTDLELMSTVGQPTLPHIIFIDADPKCDRYSLNELFEIAANLKKLDHQLFTVMLTHKEIGPQSVMTGLSHGIDAYLKWGADLTAAKDSLQEALKVKMAQNRRQLRAPAHHKIRISIDSIAQAVVSETLNVGVGGMFVRSLPQNIQMGDNVDFEFLLGGPLSMSASSDTTNPLDEFERDPHSSMKGTGWVVWVRPTSKDNLPEGMGIQFASLDSNTQRLIAEYIRNHKIQTFIPDS